MRFLSIVAGIDHRTVLGATIIALAHTLGRIVRFPEYLEQFLIAHTLRIETHQHYFGMAGQAAADLLIDRIRCKSPGITHRCGINALQFPKRAFCTPKTAQPKHRHFHAFREWGLEWMTVDKMVFRNRHRGGTSRQCLFW